ncbi:hypothetical protein K435DRAFT_508643 [Dendrothele bispora CBS 962.96]|uniref:Uncharacterized protein n=1 Tax=Dendrothele bispora (strain CBS 962.96) TaxID=1314807 RepID=A0A4S8MAY2_DENBC|nr:hypothetical protein K435DRAFT_508643 [Dendrothele bispora CBS 962.96]
MSRVFTRTRCYVSPEGKSFSLVVLYRSRSLVCMQDLFTTIMINIDKQCTVLPFTTKFLLKHPSIKLRRDPKQEMGIIYLPSRVRKAVKLALFFCYKQLHDGTSNRFFKITLFGAFHSLYLTVTILVGKCSPFFHVQCNPLFLSLSFLQTAWAAALFFNLETYSYRSLDGILSTLRKLFFDEFILNNH